MTEAASEAEAAADAADIEEQYLYAKALMQLSVSCHELLAAQNTSDRVLAALNPDVASLRDAHLDMERVISAQASAADTANDDKASSVLRRKTNVTGTTKLRWLLDSASPTFDKVDMAAATNFRKRLLQIYHPDRLASGNPELFQLVNETFATANVEMLALMALRGGAKISAADLCRYADAADRKLYAFKAGDCWRITQLYKSGNIEQAKLALAKLVDRRTVLFRTATMNSNRTDANEKE